MIKYPKTPRLEAALRKDVSGWRHLNVVVGEKVDGANVGIGFDADELVLRSRGHVLRGGLRERQFERLKGWAWGRADALRDALGGRYVLFAEWCLAKHRVFYDALPSHLLVLDVYDREKDLFLSTPKLDGQIAPLGLHSAPVLARGTFGAMHDFAQFIGPSRLKTNQWRQRLESAARRAGVTVPFEGTDDSDLMEGIYIKIEDGDRVVDRMKLREDLASCRFTLTTFSKDEDHFDRS